MTTYKGIIRATLGGAIAPGDDWTVGLSLRVGTIPQPDPDAGELNTFAQALGDAFVANVWKAAPGILLHVSTVTAFSDVKVYSYDSAGNLQSQGANSRSPIFGTGSNAHPAYVAACMTHTTEEFGRSFRGRAYLPVTAAAMSSGLQFGSSTCTTLATQWAAFLSAVLGMTPTLGGAATPVAPVVYSSKLNFTSLITGVKCDSIPDTQHGRENRFTAASVATAGVS